MVCIFIMLLTAVARLFGVLWFAADTAAVEVPSDTVVAITFSALKVFELLFTHKILCRIRWRWCLLIAIMQTVIVGFLTGVAATVVDFLFIVALPVLFNYDDWWHSLIDNVFFYTLITLYGATFLFGKVGLVYDASYDFVLGILGIVDYKMFFVVIYLVVKINGGIKLWKNQKRPLLATKDRP